MTNTNQPEQRKVKSAVQVSETYSGPLPPPEALAKYDQVVPGAAERILQMAEKEMQHRHENEKHLAKSVTRTAIVSIIFAFLSVIILSSLVFYALYKNFDTVAASIAVGAIATVAGIFISVRHKKIADKKV